MINKNSLSAVQAAHFSKGFCHPLYSSYCFSNIPETIVSFFGEEGGGLPDDTVTKGSYDHVILLFIDGFGWEFFEKYKSSLPVLGRIENEGIVSKITSMFPSTTAAHVTCIHTGLSPADSGIYEWFMYEPKLEELIAPLPFCFAGEKKLGTLPLDPKELFPKRTLYHRLNDLGVQSFAFQPKSIAESIYSKEVLSGANIIGYTSPKDAFEKIVQNQVGKTYSYFYFSDIDSIGHRKGIHSPDFQESIEEIFSQVETLYAKLPPKTALIITADHGMVEVSPDDTYYLNRKVPNIEKHLRKGKSGKALPPAGSCRDLFLHVQDENLDELTEILSHFLDGKAEIQRTRDLIEKGFFGPNRPTQNFLSRVGNLSILPYKGEAIWWYEKKRFSQNFYAAHGGLSKEEMETIFLFSAT